MASTKQTVLKRSKQPWKAPNKQKTKPDKWINSLTTDRGIALDFW